MPDVNMPVLLVDDDELILNCMSHALQAAGLTNVITCDDSREVERILSAQPVGLILLDLMMPHVSGRGILARVTAEYPEIPVIMVTGTADLDAAVTCMKLGAKDYLIKPVESLRLVTTVRQALEYRSIHAEYAAFRENVFSGCLKNPEIFAGLVSGHPDMLKLFHYVEAIAATPWPVLITGETGTGKELIAQAIHRLSGCSGKFVTVNAAGLDDLFFSDTLFGHSQGAYTGADRSRNGMLEAAANGTLFLDEIGDLAIASQVKLLRVLQDHSYYPVGMDTPRRSSARIVVATHRDLNNTQRDGSFRRDLYYRLMTHHLRLPPLRERTGDVRLLLAHFLAKAAAALGRPTPAFPPELATLLLTYAFPGNVRELEAMVADAVSRHPGRVLSMASFKNYLLKHRAAATPEPGAAWPAPQTRSGATLPTLKEAREQLVEEAMKRAGGNQTIAAGMLGLTRTALNKRLRKG